ncbi:MAG: molybdenum cofactor guanylyltransferase [Parvularculaceae bacterium]
MGKADRIAVILAGGEGRRMGGVDKGEIIFDEMRLIDHVIARLMPQSDRIIVSGRNNYGTGFAFIPDREDGPKGPAAGLWSVFHYLTGATTEGFLTVPVDAPYAPVDLFARLSSTGKSAVASDGARDHPTCAYWRVGDLQRVFEDISAGAAPSLHSIAEKARGERVIFPDARAFRNINRPEDLTP